MHRDWAPDRGMGYSIAREFYSPLHVLVSNSACGRGPCTAASRTNLLGASVGSPKIGCCGELRLWRPTHNPTHGSRCLVRLTRTLAVPAYLYVVVKPNRVTLSRQRSRVRVSSSPPAFQQLTEISGDFPAKQMRFWRAGRPAPGLRPPSG